MRNLRSTLLVAVALGFRNVLSVVIYRLRVKYGLYQICRTDYGIAEPPFFAISTAPPSPFRASTQWDESGRLFGYINFSLPARTPNWLANPITNKKLDLPLKPWWMISDFDTTVGDIKLIWEQSRMDWLIPLAQRARNGDDESLQKLNRWISDWIRRNPPYYGPNWKCGQEASIRVINLASAAIILQQERNMLVGLQDLIKIHLTRISPTIDYAIAQDNNHGTSEAAALFIGGSWLDLMGMTDAKKWEARGRRWLENRVNRLIDDDGSFSQYSVNYHRMMLDTLSFAELWRRSLGKNLFSCSFYRKASLAVSWLYQMVSEKTGDAPNIGANDGARLLPFTDAKYRDFRPSVQLAMSVFDNCKAYWDIDDCVDHLGWLGVATGKGNRPIYKNCNFDYGGYKLLRYGRNKVVIRFPAFKFRPNQADALHVDLWVEDRSLLADAGSYSYNSDPDLSWYFSGTEGHNTIQFDDRDQMPKLGRFLFGDWLKSSTVEPIVENNSSVTCCVGYVDYKNAHHKRAVKLSDDSLEVSDLVGGFKNKAVLRWRLAENGWEIRETSEGVMVTNSGHSIRVSSDAPIVRSEIVIGWMSPHYLQKLDCPILEVEISQSGRFNTEYRWPS